jgi:hypothetical protein
LPYLTALSSSRSDASRKRAIPSNRDGNLKTVRYDAVNAMLLNEFLKEHKKVQEQGAVINSAIR